MFWFHSTGNSKTHTTRFLFCSSLACCHFVSPVSPNIKACPKMLHHPIAATRFHIPKQKVSLRILKCIHKLSHPRLTQPLHLPQLPVNVSGEQSWIIHLQPVRSYRRYNTYCNPTPLHRHLLAIGQVRKRQLRSVKKIHINYRLLDNFGKIAGSLVL